MKAHRLLIAVLAAMMLTTSCRPDRKTDDDTLVILHTNDTHSAIDPDRHDMGGIVRRKVLIDSIRALYPDAMLIDAGDAVQGSLFFTMFGGAVERKLMNALGYDIRILGNHEFDNGLQKLAEEWSQVEADRISTNYDFTGTPLEGLFETSVIKEIGGHKVGFIGINLDPAGMIASKNYEGMVYRDAIGSANAEAARLKAEGAERIIAITHIGYDEEDETMPDDRALAAGSKDIDLIIGGHTHTVIDPAAAPDSVWKITNAVGRPVYVLQTGSSGLSLGEIKINLKSGDVSARLIPVDARLDSRADTSFASLITPYRVRLDSLRSFVVGNAPREFDRKSPETLNLLSDFVLMRGAELCGKPVDIAIMNRGGIRNSLSAGPITKGGIIDILPFDNRIVVLDIKGSDLLENLGIMAGMGGNGVSNGVSVTYDLTLIHI